MTFEPTLTSHRCLRCYGSGRQIDHASTGRALRRLRLEGRRTLRDVARRMKMTFQMISELELGKHRWRGELIDRYLRACGLSGAAAAANDFQKRTMKKTPTPR